MKAVYDAGHAAHNPSSFLVRGRIAPAEEKPERAERLLAGLEKGGHEIVATERHGSGPVLAVHSARYLRFLEEAHMEWQRSADAGAEIIPNVHAYRSPQGVPNTYPESIVGRAGWHVADGACPIGPGTWDAARLAADVATTATELVLAGEQAAYALCRPPGHHAYADLAGGFCFLNNSAIAALHLRRRHARVAVLDVDVHHGN